MIKKQLFYTEDHMLPDTDSLQVYNQKQVFMIRYKSMYIHVVEICVTNMHFQEEKCRI